MTTKTLNGTYDFGYSLSASYPALTITSSGVVRGISPAAYGAFGGNALSTSAYVSLANSGVIFGGAGATGARSAGKTKAQSGGGGGVGLDLAAGASIATHNLIAGGYGGMGGAAFGGGNGGFGGAAVVATDSVTLTNTYNIIGGAGGSGGAGTFGGAGGDGGVGVDLAAGGGILNSQLIAGGGGGAGGAGGAGGGGGGGGNGATAVAMADVGTVTNNGDIDGGAGSVGASYGGVQAASGDGGAGIFLTQGGTVDNTGGIAGGAASGGYHGDGGIGIYLGAAGQVTNSGSISGGNGGFDGHGGGGIYFIGRGTLANSGVIEGGSAADKYNQGGVGVLLKAGGSIDNTGTIEVADVEISGTLWGANASGVVLESGGDLANGPDGMISGYRGVQGSGATTVMNYGTIFGGAGFSVYLFGSAARLICEPGSKLLDAASGGSAATLELAPASGTVTGLGVFGTVSGAESGTFVRFASYALDAGGSWTLSGTNTLAAGQSLTSEGALTVAAASSLTLASGAQASVHGSIDNAGTIALTSTGSTSELRVLAAGATLSGVGTVVMSGAKPLITGASTAATLTNDSAISGTGFIADLTLVNGGGGVIDANAAGSLVLDTAGKTLINSGLLESSGAGELRIASTSVNDRDGGTIGSMGGQVELQNADVIGGALSSSGTGKVVVNLGSSMLDGTGGHAVSLAGRLVLEDKTSLTLEGSLINSGVIQLEADPDATSLVVGITGATLSGGGEIELTLTAANAITATAATTLTNLDNRIVGTGTIGDADLRLINEAKGFIGSDRSTALTIDTGGNTIANAGEIEGSDGGVIIESAVNNTGELIAYQGDLTVDGAVTGDGTVHISAGTADFAGALAENVFFGASGVLELAKPQSFTGTVTGFSKTGATSLDLLGITFGSATKATFSGTATSGILTVTDGAHTTKVTLKGDYVGSTFKISSDGHGGTTVVDPAKTAGPSPNHFVEAAASMAASRPSSAGAIPEPWRASPSALAMPRP